MATKLDHRRAEVKAQSDELGSSRERLLEAAARCFARRGYQGASINEIAAEAGFSKGALYWNFASKEELFFSLLDERIDRRLGALFELTGSADQDINAELSRRLSAVLDENRDLVLLFHEYSAMAVRDPKLRASYVRRNAKLREGIARAVEARQRALGVALSLPAEQIATAAIALADGLSIEQLTDPDSVPPELLGQILSLIEDGMAARAKEHR
jgi:AcrR family transcriptional regulator